MEAIMANIKFLSKNPEAKVGEVTFTLGNGLKLTAKAKAYSQEIRDLLVLHGMSQKIGDAAAGYSKDGDFAGAFAAMQNVQDNLLSGLWEARGGVTGTADLVQAVASLKKIPIEAAQKAVDALDDEKLKVVMGKPVIKAEILRIKAERAKAVAKTVKDEDLGI
jgi:hypothetical protein